MHWRRYASNETLTKHQDIGSQQDEEKVVGTYREAVDFAKDPLIHLFYGHIRAGLLAFTQPNQTPADALLKYKYMLRLAEAYLGAKYDFDFAEFRRKLENEIEDEGERLLKEVEKVAELLDTGSVRVVEIALRLRRREILNWYREQTEDEDDINDTSDSINIPAAQDNTGVGENE